MAGGTSGTASRPPRDAVTLRGVTKAFPLGEGRMLQALAVDHLAVPVASRTVVSST